MNGGKEVSVLRNKAKTHWNSYGLNGKAVFDVLPTWPGGMPSDLQSPKTPWSPPEEWKQRTPFEQPPLHSRPRSVMLSVPKVRLHPSRRILANTMGATGWVAPAMAGFTEEYPEFTSGESGWETAAKTMYPEAMDSPVYRGHDFRS